MTRLSRKMAAALAVLLVSAGITLGPVQAADAGGDQEVLLAQSMTDRMRQMGDAVANSGMMQKAVNAVQAELVKCMKVAVADDAVLGTVTGGDYRGAAVEVLRACVDRVEAGEFTK